MNPHQQVFRRFRPKPTARSRYRRRYFGGSPWWVMATLSLALLGQAQETERGTITGTVTESWEGKPLAGVTVIVRGTTLAVTTDAQGRFQLTGVPAGVYTLQFSAPGYTRATLGEVLVAPGQTSPVTYSLRPEFYEMEEYVVTAPELEQQESGLLLERQSAASLLEAIGSERFSRLAAGDAAEIMTKITGVAVVEGKFAVIRGLSDRYNLALLNGADVPSADPYRRAVQLDLFPAEVIDSVAVSKTFTPDLPGGFSGGVMDIRTKSFPERFVFKAGAGVGYNTQSTGNDRFLTYPGGGTDFLAMDDGTRKLPGELRNVSGSDLQQLLATATSGSLQIPLEAKTAAAQEMDRLVRSFGTPYMGPMREAPPPDHDFNVLVGDSVTVKGTPVGYFASLSYERDYRFYDEGIRRRYRPAGGEPDVYQDYQDSRSVIMAQWAGLASVAAKFFKHHELGYTFLYTQNAEDTARKLLGQIESSGEDQFNDQRRTHLNELHWTERNLTAHQLHGTHDLPAVHDLQADWVISLAETSQYEPDLRYFNFISFPNPNDPASELRGVDLISNNTPFPERPTRYFRELEDQNLNGKFDLTLPGEDWRGLEWKVKGGVFGSQSDRSFTERTFSYNGGSGSLVNVETFPYEYMLGTNAPPPLLVTQGNRSRYVFSRSLNSNFGNNFYDGLQDIYAAYGLVELPVIPRLRLTGGVRYETTLLQVSSSAFQSSKTFTGRIDEGDLLPGLNLTWDFRDDMKARLSYAQTVARPTYREFARYRSFDVTGDQIVEGNPFLVMTHSENFDARWEWFTRQGGLLSVGAFYKILEDPIEKFNATLSPDGTPIWTASSDFVTFLNTPEATVWGLEFEARQNLAFIEPNLKPFSLGLNAAYINTRVPLQPEIQEMKFVSTGERVTERPLYDQSPYIINADLSYDNERSGTSVTLAAYYAAERLALVVNNGWDVYEQAAPSLDLVVSQRLGRGWKAKFTARNLLNPEIMQSYAVSGSTDREFIYASFTRGITFNFSLSYEY
jgi:outer membrane receptor protein involved in Fe transport